MKSDIRDIQNEVVAWRSARGWEKHHTLTKLSHSLMVEAAELGRHFLWNKEQEGYTQTQKKEIADELADVLYHVLIMSHEMDIDIAQAMHNKLEKSAKKYPVKKQV